MADDDDRQILKTVTTTMRRRRRGEVPNGSNPPPKHMTTTQSPWWLQPATNANGNGVCQFRQTNSMHWRCMDKVCVALKGKAQYNSADADRCQLCGETKDMLERQQSTMEEPKFQHFFKNLSFYIELCAAWLNNFL